MNKKVEKEALALTILDKTKLIVNNKGEMYLLNKELESSSIQTDDSVSSTSPK